jgi:hypothetical protein
MLVPLPGQFACAIPLAPRGLACRPQGIECPWHGRALVTYYAVLATLIAIGVAVLWLRAASPRPRGKPTAPVVQ